MSYASRQRQHEVCASWAISGKGKIPELNIFLSKFFDGKYKKARGERMLFFDIINLGENNNQILQLKKIVLLTTAGDA